MLPAVVPEAVAEHFKKEMAKPDLVFKTEANSGKLEDEARARAAACEHSWGLKKIGDSPELWSCDICGLARDDAKTN